MGRGRKWSSPEDEALVRAYLQVSEDPIHGTEQKSTTFWSTINTRFLGALRATPLERAGDLRTDQALRNRWLTISHDVAKFVGCLSLVEARHESGKSPNDLIADARMAFTEQQGSAFAFDGCWQLLRKVPKFMAGTTCPQKRRARSGSAPSDQLTDTFSSESPDTDRPGGRKRAKAVQEGQRQDDKLIKLLLDETKTRNQALIAQMQRKNDLMEEQINIDLFRMAADSDESKTFFALQRRKRLAALLRETASETPALRETESYEDGAAAGSQSITFAPFADMGGRAQQAAETTEHPVQPKPLSQFLTELVPPLTSRDNSIQAEEVSPHRGLDIRDTAANGVDILTLLNP